MTIQQLEELYLFHRVIHKLQPAVFRMQHTEPIFLTDLSGLEVYHTSLVYNKVVILTPMICASCISYLHMVKYCASCYLFSHAFVFSLKCTQS